MGNVRTNVAKELANAGFPCGLKTERATGRQAAAACGRKRLRFALKTEQFQWSAEKDRVPGALGASAQVVLVFGPANLSGACLASLRQAYPNAHLFGCSTSGEIHGAHVSNDTVAITAIAFERTHVATASTRISSPEQSFAAGERLARSLDPQGLRHVLLLAEGVQVYANELLDGLHSALPPELPSLAVWPGTGSAGKRPTCGAMGRRRVPRQWPLGSMAIT